MNVRGRPTARANHLGAGSHGAFHSSLGREGPRHYRDRRCVRDTESHLSGYGRRPRRARNCGRRASRSPLERRRLVTPRLKSRRVGVWVGVFWLAVGLALFAAPGASALTPAECDARASDPPRTLLECNQTDDPWNHMKQFQAIADANPSPADGHPSRNSGEPGYKASADYVAQVMQDAGYNVTIQQYTFTYYAYTGIPSFSETSPTPHDYVLNDEWGPGQSTGTVTGGTVQPAGGIVLPPTTTPSSASGCTANDFNGFVPGRIALVQRGTCNFGVKVQNAQAAGAAGVIIFNEGNTTPDRTGLLIGGLSDAAGNPIIPTIPVAFTTFAVGQALYNQAQQSPPTATLVIPAF